VLLRLEQHFILGRAWPVAIQQIRDGAGT